jgi:arylsulfatase A-like enzyme
MADDDRGRPNVIWVFGDQHRRQALSCMGDPNVQTPNIDRMACDGVNFSAAVSGFPLCCPFRGSLLTSRYPHQCVPGHEYRMPSEQLTIAAPLREAGYHTAYFGKWHVDGWHERDGRAAMHIVPPERRGGFDVWTGYENNNAQWDSWVHGGDGDDAFHYRLPGYETDCLTDLLLDYLNDRPENQPFFAVLSVQPPHDPYVAPADWMARHNPATLQLRPNVPPVRGVLERARRELAGYYAQIENLDWNIGRLLATLEETGQKDNTYVVFFSDHGDQHGSHGQFRKTGPFEESIGIPMVIWGNGSRYDHRVGSVDAPINHVDIAPTTLGLCGLDAPDWMEGFDYSASCVKGRTAGEAPDSAFLQEVIPTGHGDSVDRAWRGVVMRDGWKYVALEHQPWLLFNLNEDPYELVNLAHNTRYGAQRARLQERLQRWIHDTGDEFALPEL